MFGRESSERPNGNHLVSGEAAVDTVTDSHEAAAIVGIPTALAILQDKHLAGAIELDVRGCLKAVVGREGFDRDHVFLVVELDHLDPAAGVVGDEPMVIEGFWKSFVTAGVIVIIDRPPDGRSSAASEGGELFRGRMAVPNHGLLRRRQFFDSGIFFVGINRLLRFKHTLDLVFFKGVIGIRFVGSDEKGPPEKARLTGLVEFVVAQREEFFIDVF